MLVSLLAFVKELEATTFFFGFLLVSGTYVILPDFPSYDAPFTKNNCTSKAASRAC